MQPTVTPRFAGAARAHVSLAVRDLAASVAFYRALFGVAPSKERAGYARFEPAEPSLNLSLVEHPEAKGGGRADHFGIQVHDAARVAELGRRLEEQGLAVRREDAVTCCHATQDKAWVDDPDGNAWEVFTVLDDDPDANAPDDPTRSAPAATGSCCAPECCA